MRVSKEALVAVLTQFNPWWRGAAIAHPTIWRRAAFRELQAWITQPPAPRYVVLSGARQMGKSTLLLQAADTLLRGGVPDANVLYVNFEVTRHCSSSLRSRSAALPMRGPSSSSCTTST